MFAKQKRWLLSAGLAVGAFAASLLLGLLVPIYTDEIGWRFQARAALDGGVDRFVAQQCGLNTIVQPPMFMLPVRYASSWINVGLADPIYVRMIGVACAICWAAMLLWLIRTIARNTQEYVTYTLLAFALLGLGVLPFLLVMSRPEQPLLLALTAASLIAATARFGGDADHSPFEAAVRSAAVVLMGVFALCFHLKAIVFMPVFLTVAVLSSRGRAGKPARICAVVALLSFTAMTLPYWVGRFQCPSDPLIAALLARQSIASTLLGSNAELSQLGLALGSASPSTYVNLVLPRDYYMSNWLPADLVGGLHGALLGFAIRLSWMGSLLIAIIALFPPLLRGLRGLDGKSAAFLPAVIAAVTTAWGFVQLEKNDYEAALALPMLVIFILLALRAAALREELMRRVRFWSAFVALIAAGSQGYVAVTYAQPLAQISRSPGYIAGQPFSYSAFGYQRIKSNIEAAGRICGIDAKRGLNGLLIDDLTYFPFMTSWRPLHRTGVITTYNGRITDPLAYLRSQKSSGMVVGCASLTPQLRARSHRLGQFCCAGPQDWDPPH